MAASAGSRIASLALRIVIFVLLLISFLVLVTAKQDLEVGGEILRARFNKVYGLRYVVSTIVLGIVYSLLQIAFSLYQVVMKGDGMVYLDFFGDKFFSYLLATGAAAGFGAINDAKNIYDNTLGFKFTTFYEKAYASTSLLLIAFFCAAALSVLSSLAVPKSM